MKFIYIKSQVNKLFLLLAFNCFNLFFAGPPSRPGTGGGAGGGTATPGAPPPPGTGAGGGTATPGAKPKNPIDEHTLLLFALGILLILAYYFLWVKRRKTKIV